MFGLARQRLLRLLKIKCLAIKHFKVHHQRFFNRIAKELLENADKQVDLQDQETKIKLLIQSKIEPVDIREIDE